MGDILRAVNGAAFLTTERRKRWELTAHFTEDFGRIQAVTLGPDRDALYITTSNTDGRGDAASSDHRLIRVPLDAF